MNDIVEKVVLKATHGTALGEVSVIQELWSGYGTIKRYRIMGSDIKTVMVKHIAAPNRVSHPHGWSGELSHQRKLTSYQVESAWYERWSSKCTERCKVPRCYALHSEEDEFFIVLEDLDTAGFNGRRSTASITEVHTCLKWLAHFHTTFLGETPEGLWETGTYWHLDTRPDEFDALDDQDLKHAAPAIDRKLKSSAFQTLVHGDAKIANFCFSPDGQSVAAVDFQYVGGGCGIKDVAYFLGGCMSEKELNQRGDELLDYYLKVLIDSIESDGPRVNTSQLEAEWRDLYPYAWADFHRFIKGWSPGHWKINDYTERMAQQVLEELAGQNKSP